MHLKKEIKQARIDLNNIIAKAKELQDLLLVFYKNNKKLLDLVGSDSLSYQEYVKEVIPDVLSNRGRFEQIQTFYNLTAVVPKGIAENLDEFNENVDIKKFN